MGCHWLLGELWESFKELLKMIQIVQGNFRRIFGGFGGFTGIHSGELQHPGEFRRFRTFP